MCTHLIRIVGMDAEETGEDLDRPFAEAAGGPGKPLVTVRMNVRALLCEYSSWIASYGAALATVATALAPGVRPHLHRR